MGTVGQSGAFMGVRIVKNNLGNVPSRLLGRLVSEDWSEYFDFVLVIREEIAPVFERW